MLYFFWVLIGFLFILSLIGTVFPIIPDTILLWIGLFIYNFYISKVNLSLYFWVGMLFISILIFIADFAANTIIIKKHGGSKLAIFGALMGLLFGTIIMGPIGIIIGPFLLVYIVVLVEEKENNQALKIAFATLIGFFSSSIIKFLLQIIMIIWFFIVVL